MPSTTRRRAGAPRCFVVGLALTSLAITTTGLSGCAAPVRRPPTLGPEASDADRRALYGKFRLQPLDNQSVLRSTELLNLNQVRDLSAGCPPAQALNPSDSWLPAVLGVAGAAAFSVGAAPELFDSDRDSDDDRNLILMLSGGGAVLLGVLLELTIQPRNRDVQAISQAYNRCLLDRINRTKRPDDDLVPRPIRTPFPELRSGPATTSTSTSGR